LLLKPDLFTVQISKTKLGFLDAREISSDASVELFTDILAGDKSILRKVFGTLSLSLSLSLCFYVCPNIKYLSKKH
jgi:hypothetical protein